MRTYFASALPDPRKSGPFTYQEFTFDYEPFYVGISYRKRRVHEHELLAKRHTHHPKCYKINSIWEAGLSVISLVYAKDLDIDSAKTIEKALIKTIGRVNKDPRGPLTNLTDGGDNTEGRVRSPASEETKEKIRQSMKKNLEKY